MSNSNQLPESNSSEHTNDSFLKKRRNFMKGSAAVPVVLTLRSGSVFAMESISCVAKLKDKNPTAVTSSLSGGSGDDAFNWVRIEAQHEEVGHYNTDVPPVFVKDYDVYVVDGKSYKVDDGTLSTLTASQVQQATVPPSKYYVLQKFGVNGQLLTGEFGSPDKINNFAVTDSCWNSIKP